MNPDKQPIPWTPAEWYQQAFESAKIDPNLTRQKAAFLFKQLCASLPDMPPQEVLGKLKLNNQERIDAVPDPHIYPELKGMRDLILAAWRGARDGAGMSEVEWAAYCNQGFLQKSLRSVAILDEEVPDKCTYIYFSESDQGPLLANNLDSSADEPFGAPPWKGLNAHLYWGRVSSGVFLDEVQELFPVPLEKLLSRFCHSVPEATELLERYKRFWGPANAILADKDQRIAMVEKSACRIGIRYSNNGYGFVTSMTAEHPEFRQYLDDRREASLRARGLPPDCADVQYWKAADKRRLLLKDLLSKASSAPTWEKLRAAIQHRSSAGLVALHGDPLPGGGRTGFTLRTTIWRLNFADATWWAMSGNRPSFEATPRTLHYPEVTAL